jgi:rhodanese-related sulfurtransferase
MPLNGASEMTPPLRFVSLSVMLLGLLTGCSHEISVSSALSALEKGRRQVGFDHPQGKQMDKALLAEALKEIQSGAAILLDVRESDEWESMRLANSRHFPMSALADEGLGGKMLEDLETDRTVYTHCLKGLRAIKCAEHLKSKGWKAIALPVAYDELIAAGFPAADVKAP